MWWSFKMKMTKLQREACDKRATAFHEAGHIAVANHFGLTCYGYIRRRGDPTNDEKAFTGQTIFENTTDFRKAVIGWGGTVGEHFADIPVNEWPQQDLYEFEDINYEMHSATSATSETDVAHINGHAQRRRALRTAWRIVVGQRTRVASIAKLLMAKPVDPRTAKAMELPEFKPLR
jgi:hypothetical protein